MTISQGTLVNPCGKALAVVARSALVVAAIFVLFAASALPTRAHAFLQSSDPPANAVVPTAPGTVTLQFTEPLETSYSRVELFDESGSKVSGAVSTVGTDPYTMTVEIPAGLGNGTYSLLWRTLSTVDGHTAQGYLPFTVGTQADVRIVDAPVANATASAVPELALAAARWLALVGLIATVAIWSIWLFVVRPALSPVWQLGPKTTRRVRAYTIGAVIFSLLANVVALVVQAMSIAGPEGLFGGLRTTLSETRYGTWWLIRVGLLLIFAALLMGVAWWWPRRQPITTRLTLLAALVLPIPYSMISHAGAEPVGQATAIAFDYAHLLGASVWAGGLLFLIVALAPTVRNLTPAGQKVVLGRAIPRFSLLALVAWGVMALTGFYSSLLQVGNIPALISTPYGQTLILKLILVVPLLLLGAFNLIVVTRRLRRAETEDRVERWGNHFVTALIAEAVVVTLLVGVVGMLIGTPPARQVMVQEAGSLRIPLDADGQTGSLIITPGTVGQNHYRLELGTGHEAHLRNPAITDAALRLELPEQRTGQIDVSLIAAPSGGYEAHGSEISLPGDWQMQTTVRMPGQPDWVVNVTRPITAEPPASQAPGPPPLFAPMGIAALALVILGMGGIAAAGFDRAPRFRREAIGLGTVAILAGIVLLAQARIPPTDATAADPEVAIAALDPGAVERGSALFAQNCAACHGPGAKGDGPEAASLARPPADLTSGHSVPHPDVDYAFWIENGIAGTDMPAFGSTLDSGQIQDVIAYVRSLQQSAILARDAPGPEDCVVEPRTLDSIAALADDAIPVEPPNATERGGNPADEATQAEVTHVAREMVACSNAGDILRRLALYSDDRLRFAYPDGPTRALEAIAETPLPLAPYERVALVGVEDVRTLDDGRVSARVIVDNPAAHSHDPAVAAQSVQQETARLIFVNENGSWRVDETRREETPTDVNPVATPASG